ncbi:MAG: glycosyltransferase, partial [Actinomycetota bacterium]
HDRGPSNLDHGLLRAVDVLQAGGRFGRGLGAIGHRRASPSLGQSILRRYNPAVKEVPVRILVWHGWLLEGTGSNVYTAKVAEVWRRQGHEVLLLCQQPPSDRLDFVDVWQTPTGPGRVEIMWAHGGRPTGGQVTVVRPDIGPLLPVFVLDEYEGFEVKRFVDLTEEELDAYLERNVSAVRDAAGGSPADAVIAGHLVPGPVVARRALGDGYVAKVHGSDLEYTVRLQERYAELAREGVEGARAVVGASRDVLARTVAVAPAAEGRTRVIPPGVDVERWRPRLRPAAIEDASARLDVDPDTVRGRPSDLDRTTRDLLAARHAPGLEALPRTYEQGVPDPAAAERLRALARHGGPVIGYLGKLIPEKGVERLLEAAALLGSDVRVLVVGFGLGREWLAAVVAALDDGDPAAHEWLGEASRLELELDPEEVRAARGFGERVTFTGRLDHRYAPEVVAALDVLVVPSTLEEAFGMVAAEGAAAGALPLVARHSSLAEVAEALEGAAGRPDALSFEPGAGATRRLAEALEALLALDRGEREGLRGAVRAHVAAEWTWERTAERLLDAAVR